MKAPVQAARRVSSKPKKRLHARSSLIYRACKEVRPAGVKGSDLMTRSGIPRLVLLRLVSSEASRLSRSNRLKVITLQEITAAVALLQQRIHTRAAA